MTDNRTTELLRKGLTDRGIKWRSGLEGVTFVGDWCFVEYDNGRLAATCEAALTPEQAIAATLGNGTLTAEQVMAIAGKHQPDYCSDTHVCFDWQAIADELNAELRSGTCEWILEHSGTLYDKWRCSKCGYLYVDSRTDGGATDLDPNYCPNCGRRVVNEC